MAARRVGEGRAGRGIGIPAAALGLAVLAAAVDAAAGGGGGGPAGDGTSTWGSVELPSGLSLAVEAVAPAGDAAGVPALRATIRNDGPDPVFLALDPRLADLEFRSGRERLRCASPDPIGPAAAQDVRWESVAPGSDASVDVDPRFHCWTRIDRFASRAAGRDADASVSYRVILGDPQLGAATGRAGTLAATTVLAVPAGDSWRVAGGPAPDGGEASTFSVEAGAADVSRGGDVGLTVTVRNLGGATVKLVDHPTQFRFEVRGPTGEWDCSMGALRVDPIPDLLVRLRGRGGRYVRRVEMALYCPAPTFEAAGFYEVVPIYDPYLAERSRVSVWEVPVRGAAVPVRVRRGEGAR